MNIKREAEKLARLKKAEFFMNEVLANLHCAEAIALANRAGALQDELQADIAEMSS